MTRNSAEHTRAGYESVPVGDATSLSGRFEGDHILAPILTSAVPTVRDQIEVATTLARTRGASLSLFNPLSGPNREGLEFYEEVTHSNSGVYLDWALEQTTDVPERVTYGILLTRNIVKNVLSTTRSRDVDTLVLTSDSLGFGLRGSVTQQIASHADCDVIVVNGEAGLEEVPSILLPIAGGPHSGLAADIARTIAADSGAWIDILHVVDENAPSWDRRQANELVEDVYDRVARPKTTSTWVLEARDVPSAIAEQSHYYRLTVIGAPTTGRLGQLIQGSTNQSVRDKARSVVLSVRDATGSTS